MGLGLGFGCCEPPPTPIYYYRPPLGPLEGAGCVCSSRIMPDSLHATITSSCTCINGLEYTLLRRLNTPGSLNPCSEYLNNPNRIDEPLTYPLISGCQSGARLKIFLQGHVGNTYDLSFNIFQGSGPSQCRGLSQTPNMLSPGNSCSPFVIVQSFGTFFLLNPCTFCQADNYTLTITITENAP